MSKYIFKNAEGDESEHYTLDGAKQTYKKYIGGGEDGWCEDTVLHCSIKKNGKDVCRPVQIDKVLPKDMDKETKDMCIGEGWSYICDYEMQEINKTND